jgi:hypothetical protein
MKKMTRFALVLGGMWVGAAATAHAQTASALYTWDNTGNAAPNVENWVFNFGSNSVTLSNGILGELTIVETGGAGASVAISDGANRVRESALNAIGGTDVTGLDWLEFDLGHNGSGPINVQFFVQASTGFSFLPLGPDLAVTPGVNTYQVPLTGLTAAQAVYLRTVGFNAKDHNAVGDVTWTLREVRTGGTPLTVRNLITHNAGTPEGGLQGVIANFDVAAIQGNDGGQNQSGFSWNSSGSGSLQWTDLGGSNGAAVSWGNGTAWNGNTFNERTTDLTGYDEVIVTISATDPLAGGGTLGVQSFFQRDNFALQSTEAGAARNLPIDGEFHELRWSLAGLTQMNVVDLTGINLFSHSQNLVINVDNIRFEAVPEPSTLVVLGMGVVGLVGRRRWVAER